MKPYCLCLATIALLCLAVNTACVAQNVNESPLPPVSAKYIDAVSKKSGAISEELNAKTTKAIKQFQKREAKLKQKLYRVDSLAANNVFNSAAQRYKQLDEKLNNPQQLAQYIPFLDTLKTLLKFLDKNKELLAKSGDLQKKMDGALGKMDNLESEIQKAEYVKQFLKERKQFLKEQLEKFGFAKQLKKFNKEAFYYGQQVAEYKEAIKDTKKLERKAIDLLSRTRLFQDFMKKNSMLASLFRMPADDPNDPAYLQSLAGLQTRSQVNQFIQNQIGSGGPAALQQVQSNVQQGQGLLQQLKNKVTRYGSSSDDIMPEGFKPSTQKTKSFFKRLEYGTNIQTQKAQYYFPVTTDIGLSVGYKLNDKSVIGIGASYKVGLGYGWKDIHYSNEGAGFRSYIDWKLKGSFWLSGGFEANYRTAFTAVTQLKQFDSWQQSGLIGLSKVVDVKSAVFKKTKLQLLWDMLSYRQIPKTQPVLFRIAYGFK